MTKLWNKSIYVAFAWIAGSGAMVYLDSYDAVEEWRCRASGAFAMGGVCSVGTIDRQVAFAVAYALWNEL